MLNLHRLIGTYSKTVDAYIALARFSRDKFISGGLPASKVHVLPNFLADDPGFGTGSGGYALFVGRLSEEKGLRLLLDAWNLIPNIPLKIVGDGPLFQLTAAANVEWLGVRSADSVVQLMSDAKCVVVPSLWYEAAPRVVMESLAVGTPVVAPAHGFFPEAISDPANGVLFQPGSMTELAKAIERMFCSNGAYGSQRQAARATYLLKYTHEVFSSSLLDIYESAIEQRGNTCAKGHARKFAARQ
jgi:glycosyltransferase involved in cell wall biosynthesis